MPNYYLNQIHRNADGTANLEASVIDGLDAGEWDDLILAPYTLAATGTNVPALSNIMKSQGAAGTAGVWAWGFLNTREDSLHVLTQLPHSYRQGTDLKLHVHWTMVTATTGTVRWGFEYCMADPTTGNFAVTKAANAATTRQQTGTTARLTFNSAHGLVVNQNIVVAGAGVAAYNGNYKVTAASDSAMQGYWIEYTIASGTEAATVDASVNVMGYTIQLEATHTLSANSLRKHLITEIGTIPGTTGLGESKVSRVLIGRFYRPVLAGHIAERIPITSIDLHYQKDTGGSVSEWTKP